VQDINVERKTDYTKLDSKIEEALGKWAQERDSGVEETRDTEAQVQQMGSGSSWFMVPMSQACDVSDAEGGKDDGLTK
jgi:hypothetical protein